MKLEFWLNILLIVVGGELMVESFKFLFSGKITFVSDGKLKIGGPLAVIVALVMIVLGGYIFWYGLAPLLKQFL